MISRRRFLTGVAIALSPMGATAHAQEYKAQQAGKVPQVGLLDYAEFWNPLRQGLSELGYVEGKTIVFEFSGHGRVGRR